MLKLNGKKTVTAFTRDKSKEKGISHAYLYKSDEAVFNGEPIWFAIPKNLIDKPPKKLEVTVELK